MKEVLINVQDLEKNYGKKEVLRGISFTVAPGEIFCIIGPNGSGKTTTMEILEGVRTPSGGSFTIFGKSPKTRYVRENIGVAVQDSVPLTNLRVEEILRLHGSLYAKSLPPERVLEAVGLKAKRKSLVRTLSGGEKQRLNVATALINDPRILFLDEPTGGLDPSARRELWESMKKLKNQGKTIIFTTHYMEEAERLSDRIAILKNGRIQALDTPKKLLGSLGIGKRIDFEFEIPLDGMLEELQNRFNIIERGSDLYSLFTKNIERDIEALMEFSRSMDLNILGLTIHSPDLEDVYIAETEDSE